MTTQLHVNLGSHGQIKLERVGSGLLDVYGLVALVRQGLAQHLDFVLLHILVHLLTHNAIDDVHLHGVAIHTLNHTHGHHTRTEARHVGLLTIVFQCLLDILLVVVFLDCDGHQTIHFVGAFKCNIHLFYLRFTDLRVTILSMQRNLHFILGCKGTHFSSKHLI